MFVPNVGKMAFNVAANDEFAEVNFLELTKLADKRKWQGWFAKDYKGGLRAMNEGTFREDIVKCVIAVNENKEKGYMRLVDKTERFKYCGEKVWCLEDAYVKPAYRKERVFEKMARYAIANYGVKVMHITDDRYERKRHYFNDMGFNNFIYTNNGDLGYLLHDDYLDLLKAMPLAA